MTQLDGSRLQLSQTRSDIDDEKIEQKENTYTSRQIARPWVSLSMSVSDPFDAKPACIVPRRLLDIQMSDTRQNLLTMVTTRKNDPSATASADGIMRFMRDSETTLTSVTAAAVMYWRIARGNDHSRYQAELMASGRVLKLLSKAMTSNSTAVTEANIWAVLAMSYCGGGEILKLRTGKLPRRSFLREVQSLHVYGRLRPNEAHVMGLLKLTGMLGGIDNIKTYGIAQIMSFCAILESTRHMVNPGLPFIPYSTSSIVDDRIMMGSHEWSQASSFSRLGIGFHKVWPDVEQMKELKHAVTALCNFTIIVENHIEGRSAFRTASEITDARNFTQYKLMTLEVVSKGMFGRQYESARIACITYSYLIVMPLPPVVGLYENIAATLQNALNREDKEGTSMLQADLELKLWTKTMGAIVSIGLDTQQWFVSRIREDLEILDVQKWRELILILESFLWHPSTNEADGREVWALAKHRVLGDKG